VIRRQRLSALAGKLGGEVRGTDPLVRGVRTLEEAGPADLAPFTHVRFRRLAETTHAGAILCPPALVARAGRAKSAAIWIHPEPWVALATLLALVRPPARGGRRVHRTARVAKGVVIEPGAKVGARTRIGPNAVVCAGSTIGDDCEIGPGAVVGAGVEIGRRVRIGPGAVVGSDGFGYVASGDKLLRIPHVGRVVVEDDVDVGANACIARATLGTTRVSAGARIDALVQIGHNAVVGEGSILAAQVGLAGSVRLGRGVQVGGQAGVADHVEIGDGARLAAKAGVIGDVAPGETVAGYPARPRARWLREHATLARIAAPKRGRR